MAAKTTTGDEKAVKVVISSVKATVWKKSSR
jgi:hypothetical protein